MRPARAPREQLLLREADGELAMALFVDAAALANLERNDPAARLDDDNFTDFCLAVEGVSHFVYLALRAAQSRPVSQLELELQAEVDKFACCLLVAGTAASLRRRLYGDVVYADDLDADERERYRTANREAGRYAAALERRFLAREQTVRAARRAAAVLSNGSARQAGAHRPARLIASRVGGASPRRSPAQPPA